MSDGWPAYQQISELGGGGLYSHDVIVHQQNFVSPVDPEVHTQNIEAMWKHAKKRLRNQSGTSEALFLTYIKEFMWRRNFVKDRSAFDCICFEITRNYTL